MAQGSGRSEEEALEFIRPIIPLLEQGMSMQQSCDYAGIDRSTVVRYKQKFERVATEIKTAQMKLIARATETVNKFAGKDPKIALEALKRRSRKEWGDNVDHTTKGNELPQPILGGASVQSSNSDTQATKATQTD